MDSDSLETRENDKRSHVLFPLVSKGRGIVSKILLEANCKEACLNRCVENIVLTCFYIRYKTWWLGNLNKLGKHAEQGNKD